MQLRVLHDALQHGRQHRLHVGVVRQLFERLVHEVVELLLQHIDVPAAGADDVAASRSCSSAKRRCSSVTYSWRRRSGLVDGEFEGCLELLGDHSDTLLHRTQQAETRVHARVRSSCSTFISAISYV